MPDSEVRAQYLSLALRSRRLIDDLIRYVDKGELTPSLHEELQSAKESIEAVNSNENVLALFSQLSSKSLFSHYEQLRLIEEVREELGNPNISTTISHFIASDKSQAAQREDAFVVLHFFSTLEARALHGYSVQMQVART
jgi:GTP1/Obg family GTP-binding protein